MKRGRRKAAKRQSRWARGWRLFWQRTYVEIDNSPKVFAGTFRGVPMYWNATLGENDPGGVPSDPPGRA